MKHSIQTVLSNIGFVHAANYSLVNSENKCVLTADWPAAKRLPGEKVYAMTAEEGGIVTLKYVGETKQRARPFLYLSNVIMKDVRQGILNVLKDGGSVKVWLYEDFDSLKATVGPITFKVGRHALEALLIKTYDPAWNRRK